MPIDGASASGSLDMSFRHTTVGGLFGSNTFLSTTKGIQMVRSLLPAGNLDQMYPAIFPDYLYLQRPALQYKHLTFGQAFKCGMQ